MALIAEGLQGGSGVSGRGVKSKGALKFTNKSATYSLFYPDLILPLMTSEKGNRRKLDFLGVIKLAPKHSG